MKFRLRKNQSDYAWQHQASPVKLKYLKHAKGKTALDIGTGKGFYGAALQSKGFVVEGVDMEPRQGIPFPVVKAQLNDLQACSPADTVLLFDVLEHEPDEAAALQELQRLVKKRLLLSVPSADRARLTPYNLTYKHHIDKTHQREYGVDELQQKLESVGFRILHIKREGPVRPEIFSEFIRPKILRSPVRLLIKILSKLRVLKNDSLMADLYVVAEPQNIQ